MSNNNIQTVNLADNINAAILKINQNFAEIDTSKMTEAEVNALIQSAIDSLDLSLDAAAVRAIIEGSDLDMSGNKVLFGNMYQSVSDLPNASTYHGMFAHVHGTGAGYFAHGGNWVKLANHADLSSVSGSTTAGGVGTYSLLGKTDGSTTSLGTDVSGSSLRYSSTYSYSPSYYGMSGSAPSGTWRCMSVGGAYNDTTTAAKSTTVTIFLRIS